MHPLQGLGVSADAERIYLGLVERGEASASEFPQVCLVELERLGLIKLKEDQVIAFPPQLAMERLAQRHTREAALARESATVLAQLRAAGIGQRDDLELLPPPEAAGRPRPGADRRREPRPRDDRGNLAPPDHKIVEAPNSETKRLLTCLSAGLTDESIAREFGVSERTIARRISRLQETLGAQTRFQLGVQASRQGWL
jgi:DNA-binding CsgD family transcriptional regulator